MCTKGMVKHSLIKARSTVNIFFCARYSTDSLNIFDRKTKKLHRDWAAVQDNGNIYNYLKDEVRFHIILKIIFIV